MIDAFVKAFIMPADKDQAHFVFRPLFRQRLFKRASSRAHGNDRSSRRFGLSHSDGFHHRFRFQHHSHAAPKRRVVHRMMPVQGKIPRVDAFHLKDACIHGALQHAVACRGFNLFREQGDKDKFHRISSSLLMPRAGISQRTVSVFLPRPIPAGGQRSAGLADRSPGCSRECLQPGYPYLPEAGLHIHPCCRFAARL